jgi:5-methyltetrahydrofolate--homocysteine methyltransferase
MDKTAFTTRMNAGKVLVSDGATGTNLQIRGLPRGATAELWVLEQPEQIMRLARDFIEAGADLVLTCTFGGTTLRLEHSGLAERAAEINRKAVELARQAAAGTQALVAGSIGPTGKLLKPLGPLQEAQAVAAFAAQAGWLAEAGVDFLVVETQFDLGEAKAAIQGVRSVTDLPVVCSFSYDGGVHTMMGVKPAQAGRELAELGVDMVGINCGRSLEENLANLKQLKAALTPAATPGVTPAATPGVGLPVWFKPNAGLPRLDQHGDPTYDVTPEAMGQLAAQWAAAGAQVVGGCCGTTPAHLRQIALAVK